MDCYTGIHKLFSLGPFSIRLVQPNGRKKSHHVLSTQPTTILIFWAPACPSRGDVCAIASGLQYRARPPPFCHRQWARAPRPRRRRRGPGDEIRRLLPWRAWVYGGQTWRVTSVPTRPLEGLFVRLECGLECLDRWDNVPSRLWFDNSHRAS